MVVGWVGPRWLCWPEQLAVVGDGSPGKKGAVGRYFVSRLVVGCGVVLGKLRVPGQLAPGGNGSPQLHAQPSHHNREEGRTGYQRGSCAEPGAGSEGLTTAALTRAAFLPVATTERGVERDTKTRVLG